MACWICGGTNSSAKVIQRSDPETFSERNRTSHPHGTAVNGEAEVTVATLNRMVCLDCDQDRTKDWRESWTQLADFLRSRPSESADTLDLVEAFPHRTAAHMLQVHLHFVKLFGSEIDQIGLPIDLEPFSTAILTEEAHPHLYLGFGGCCGQQGSPVDVYIADRNGCLVYANWLYSEASAPVNVIFAEPSEMYRPELSGTWHPREFLNKIRIARI